MSSCLLEHVVLTSCLHGGAELEQRFTENLSLVKTRRSKAAFSVNGTFMDLVAATDRFKSQPNCAEIVGQIQKNARTMTCPITKLVLYEVPDYKTKQVEEEAVEERNDVLIEHGRRPPVQNNTGKGKGKTGDAAPSGKMDTTLGKGTGKDKGLNRRAGDAELEQQPPQKKLRPEASVCRCVL